jgi:hypothetical protein
VPVEHVAVYIAQIRPSVICYANLHGEHDNKKYGYYGGVAPEKFIKLLHANPFSLNFKSLPI